MTGFIKLSKLEVLDAMYRSKYCIQRIYLYIKTNAKLKKRIP